MGLEKISGYKKKGAAAKGTLEMVNELNHFFNSLDQPTPSIVGWTGPRSIMTPHPPIPLTSQVC